MAAKESIQAGQSCVVDNTNPSQPVREFYISLARELDCRIRCVFFSSPLELAKHNNVYRACYQAKKDSRGLLPATAFTSYKANLAVPRIEEGFDEIKQVNFVFEGEPEELKNWNKHLV